MVMASGSLVRSRNILEEEGTACSFADTVHHAVCTKGREEGGYLTFPTRVITYY